MRIRALNFERCLTNMEEGKRQILLRVDSIASLLASQSTIWYWKTSTADHGCIQKYDHEQHLCRAAFTSRSRIEMCPYCVFKSMSLSTTAHVNTCNFHCLRKTKEQTRSGFELLLACAAGGMLPAVCRLHAEPALYLRCSGSSIALPTAIKSARYPR
jgi:hypothetical protein